MFQHMPEIELFWLLYLKCLTTPNLDLGPFNFRRTSETKGLLFYPGGVNTNLLAGFLNLPVPLHRGRKGIFFKETKRTEEG